MNLNDPSTLEMHFNFTSQILTNLFRKRKHDVEFIPSKRHHIVIQELSKLDTITQVPSESSFSIDTKDNTTLSGLLSSLILDINDLLEEIIMKLSHLHLGFEEAIPK